MYADIIVDISYEKLDKAFQYNIPDSLLSDIQIGSQVIIPFGNGNRQMKGYVIGVSNIAKCPVEKMKSIQNIVKRSTTIEGRMIQLASWIRNMYGSTMNQALKTVIPIKQVVKSKEKRTISLVYSAKEAAIYLSQLDKRSIAKKRLLEALLESPDLVYEDVTKKLSIAPSTIQALSKEGIISVTSEGIYRNPFTYQGTAPPKVSLTPIQKVITQDFYEDYQRDIRRTYLLYGITGSGKTQVYIEMIAKVVKLGRQAIVLIPEIALTYQTIRRFYEHFGERVSIMNSKMSQGERYDQYERVKRGELDIVIGPRSALFVPFPNLGLIVIDEEHETSYKSESVPKYHARETAQELSSLCNASLVLGSATPSIESYYRALTGEYKLYRMDKRAKEQNLPDVHVVDLRSELKQGNKSIFSRQLYHLMEECLQEKHQTILFINRRGYAGFVSCRACGNPIRCPHCDVSLTVHEDKTLRCHYCGHSISMPSECPACGSGFIAPFGTGTQKVEEAVRREFPHAKVLRMDTDTTSKKGGHEAILKAFANHEADILIGTQMIVKGHDFPLVTLVGVIAADLSLFAGDYHSNERTFQLLTQAAGRAGRGSISGEVVIQTYNPEHYSIQTASMQDYEAFYEREILYRTLLKYPPAGHMMAILFTSSAEDHLNQFSDWLEALAYYFRKEEGMLFLGPSDAGISKINDVHRKVLYVKYEDLDVLLRLKDNLEKKITEYENKRDLQVQFDVDPVYIY